MNISAIGFAPLLNTIPKLHDHNEYINADTYLRGIEIYEKIITNLANKWGSACLFWTNSILCNKQYRISG